MISNIILYFSLINANIEGSVEIHLNSAFHWSFSIGTLSCFSICNSN